MERTTEKIAVAYMRVSTEDQNLGLGAQKKAIEDYAKSRNIRIASWHLDRGVSGGASLDERPALLDAFRAIHEHEATVLLAARRDRIARDVGIALMLERDLFARGVTIITADGVSAENTPEGGLLRALLDSFAQYERELIRARTKAALAVKKASGQHVGRPPYGFLMFDGKLTDNAYEQNVIMAIVSLHKHGSSLREIMEKTRTAGFLARNGRPLSFQLIRDVVSRHKRANAA